MINRSTFSAILTLLAVLVLLPTSSHAAGKGFYPDGQLKWEYLFQDGKISEAKWYNEEGKLVSREIYADGQPEKTEGYRADGSLEWQTKTLPEERQEVLRFDEAGNKTALYQVQGGLPDGEYTTYTAEGQVKQTVTYKQGILDGPARSFFPSGQVEHEFAYSNGEVDGPYRTYSEDGTLLSEYTFSAGKLQ